MVESHTQAPFRATVNTDYITGETFFKVQQGSTKENYQYFYHPDHLGSSSYLTDVNGDVSQHVEYLPYGELFLEERNNKWNTSYLFNAKELDEETGLYYVSQRYHDPKTNIWLSVDQLRAKYPNISSYAFCAGNPVKYVDLDGKEWGYYYDSKGNLHINVDIKFTNNTNLSDKELKVYKNTINSEFSRMLGEASGGRVIGSVTYNGGSSSNQFTPTMILNSVENSSIAGNAGFGTGIVNILDAKSNMKSPTVLAADFLHELLHSVRLDHPFEVTQTNDAVLTKISKNSYITMLGTNADDMRFNVMSYPMIKINGISYSDLNTDETQSRITPGQIQFMLKEIDTQKAGYGLKGKNFFDYWLNRQGYEVK